MSRWMGIHRGIVRRPGMNGRNISRSVSSIISAQTCTSALSEVDKGLICYQNV